MKPLRDRTGANVLLGMAAGVLTVVVGCAVAGGPPKVQPMAADIVASADLNLDYSGRPSPVVVRTYQLRAAGAFQGADFFTLYANAEAVLAADLVVGAEFPVQPGQISEMELEIDPQTRWVGVMAAYRDIENAKWRAVVELPQDKLIKTAGKNRLRIELNALAVFVAVGKPR